MSERDFIKSSAGEKQKKGSGIMVICFRWMMLVTFLTFFIVSGSKDLRFVFFETFAVAAIYNVLITLGYIKHYNKLKRIEYLVLYVDAVLVSLFICLLGGIHSDFYVLYLFIIGYCGVFNKSMRSIKIGVFCMLAYTAACFLAAKQGSYDIDYWRLAIKNIFIVISSYGICFINYEVKRYDEMHKKEFKLARTDKLTGLANRHYFEQKLGEEVEYSDKSGNPINVLIFDLDNFKRFNDTYGHIWGDKLLLLFSDIIKQNIRNSDIPIRYGGEEFLLLIRDIDLKTAKLVGDRIRKQLEKQRIYVGNDDSRKLVTVSCGIAQYPRNSTNMKEVIDLADKALYHAKETGKNAVVCYDEMVGVSRAISNE